MTDSPLCWNESKRWAIDRGAMPGEPFAFLDGDSETAEAVMVEVENPGKESHFEVRRQNGILLSREDHPSTAAKVAEELMDLLSWVKNDLDEKDQKFLNEMLMQRDEIQGPRIGDYVLFSSGQLERFSYDWTDKFQTSPGGSFHLGRDGYASLSCGGLNPSINKSELVASNASLPGPFWFFHHGVAGAGRGVYIDLPCRVFTTDEKYPGFMGKDFQNIRSEKLINSLRLQMEHK